jgi:hypothetical protein
MSPALSETRDSRDTKLRLDDVEAGFPIDVITPCDTVLLLFIPTVVFSKPEKHFINYLILRINYLIFCMFSSTGQTTVLNKIHYPHDRKPRNRNT